MKQPKMKKLPQADAKIFEGNDKLAMMFNLQKDFNHTLKYNNKNYQEYMFQMIRCIRHELCEIEDWLQYKHWKTYEETIDENMIEIMYELADVWCFLLSAIIETCKTPDTFFQIYLNKMQENDRRQNEGY